MNPTHQSLLQEFKKAGIANLNLSLIDDVAHACVRRVFSRLGVAGYTLRIVWPVLTVTSGPIDAFVFDVRELGPE